MSSILPPTFRFPRLGERILCQDNEYVITGVLGQGAFGLVYECSDSWGNELAAKVLHPLGDRTYEQVRTEWAGELDRLVALRHPNITFIYDAFEYNETFYLVMERCTYTLRQLIELPEHEGELWIPYVARDLLQAIHFIHNRGYVHKDIHPGNVFVSQTPDRMVPSRTRVWSFKVGDLGISRLEGDINVFNTILAQWMLPPEYLDHNFGPIGRGVDIYHTGLLLLSLLLGVSPNFTRDEILDGKPRMVAENLPSRFALPISRALRRHTVNRTSSAMQLWREIAEVLPSQQ